MVQDERLLKSLSYIFNESQDGNAAHSKLITKCQQIYKENDFNKFYDSFVSLMGNIMVVMQKNAHVDRIIEFIAKFSACLSTSTNKQKQNEQETSTQMELDETDSELGNPFLVSLINHLIEINKANSDAVRYRSSQLLAKLMSAITNDQSIDEDLYDRLCDALLERLRDINSRVQVQAISAIYRLQDPNDKDCRVIRALVFLMSHDPHWQVRFQALASVAFTKQTLPEIIDRVRDPQPQVRRKALLILSEKVLIKFISIEKRLFILNYSLKDDDESVSDTCCKKLLPSWLAFKENDLCKLLKALDVVDSTETCELMLNKMYANSSLDNLSNDFSHLINEKHVIPIDKIDAESVFYWYWICSKCKNSSSTNKQDKQHEQELTQQIDSQEHLDNLLSSLTEYCEYVQEALKKLESDRLEKIDDERYQIENTFVVKQLIKMFTFIDFSDVHGKKNLTKLCHDLFSNKNYLYLYDTLMKVYKILYPNLQQRINNLVELISDLREPSCTQTQTNQASNTEQLNTTSLNMTTNEQNESTLNTQEIQFKIAELKFQRFKLKDDFDNMYKEFKNVNKTIDMNRLTELRNQIKEIEDKIACLQEKLNPDMVETEQKETTESNTSSEPVQDPIEVSYHCLNLAVCLLQDAELKTLTPQLRSLCDTLILPNISSINEELRQIAVLGLGLICILKIEMAQKYVPLLLEVIQRDKKEVVLESFKAIINCVMAFSINKLVNSSDQSDQNLVVEATSKIMSVMTSLLDHEDPEVYTTAVEGFCKLYMTGHILSAKLFSKLLIMYYSPLTENDVKLRAFLSCFLPQFSFFRPINQLCVEESFMLTLKCLMNAPADSYLSSIDLIKVMETLFNLSNPKNLLQRNVKTQNTNICHENIVKSICYEILKDDNSFKFKTYLKVIQMSDLSEADYLSLKNIHELAEEVHEHIEDKLVKKMAKKFSDSVLEVMIKKPEYKQECESQSKDQTLKQNESEKENETKLDQTVKNQANDSSIIDYEFPKIIKKANKQNKTLSNSNVTNRTILNETQTQIQARRSSPRIQKQPTNSRIIIEKDSNENQEKKEQELNKSESERFNLKEIKIIVNKLDLNNSINTTMNQHEEEKDPKSKKVKIDVMRSGSLKRSNSKKSTSSRSLSASQSDTNSQEDEPPVKTKRNQQGLTVSTTTTRTTRSQSARKENEKDSNLKGSKKTREQTNLYQSKINTRSSSNSATRHERRSPRNIKK